MAKNDIRGLVTGQPLADALDHLELDGAQCGHPESGGIVICAYDEHTSMALYYGTRQPQNVEEIVYRFSFKAIETVKDKLQKLYGLKKSRIEGEHRLFTGERLIVELETGGNGRLSLVNDAQIRDDRTADAKH